MSDQPDLCESPRVQSLFVCAAVDSGKRSSVLMCENVSLGGVRNVSLHPGLTET